jgi:SAM-dependent methyltransferase
VPSEADRPPSGAAAGARAVYEATAHEYARFAGTTISDATETADDRQHLTDALRRAGRGPVADLGSGPGRVAAMCQALDLAAVAVDMTVAMLRTGHEHHPRIPFVAGYLSSLPFRTGSFGGAVLWYSIIHTPPAGLGPLFAEVRRVVAGGAPVLVAFQAGHGEAHERPDAYGTGHTLVSWRHEPGFVAAALDGSGFADGELKVRPPELPHESAPQAFVVTMAPPR